MKRRELSPKLKELLDYRIEQEEMSSRIYLAMSMFLDNEGYTNSAKLWKKYSDEELIHADKVREYLLSLGIQPGVPALSKPEEDFEDLAEIIEKSYEHEVDITNQCEELTKACQEEGDYLIAQLGFWLMTEQREELEKTQNLLDQLRTFGTDKTALRLLDDYIEDLID